MLSDPIADMLTRIRNAYQAGHKTVKIPYSGFKKEICQVLLQNNYLKGLKKTKNNLELILQYHQGKPAITQIKKISKLSLRVYKAKNKLPYVLSGLGMAIISTSKGVMTANQARKKRLGGEIICEVW